MCVKKWSTSVSVKNQYQHLYQLGMGPKNLSVPLHVANSTEKPLCTIEHNEVSAANGTEKPFCTIECNDVNSTERFFCTVGHVQWYRKVFRYCS